MALLLLHEAPAGLALSGLSDDGRLDGESDAAFASRMASAIVAAGARWVAVEHTALPQDVAPERWSVDWDTGGIAAAPISVEALAAYAADKRYRVETGGFMAPAIGPVATDRASQSKLISEMVALSASLRAEPGGWKLRDGTFALLSNAQMLGVIVAARAHIATAFAVEHDVTDAIAAGTITSFEQIDAAAWPPNV